MKLGFMCGVENKGVLTLDELVAQVQRVEALGFDQAWLAQVFSTDAITALSIIGRETQTIRLGTAVTPSFPRHPTSLAMQILTASAACKGRFDLGLGLSHQLVIEGMFGIPYQQPAKHMREYLEVLMPLARGEACDFEGELFKVHAQLNIPDAVTPVSVIVAALGPKMLEVAGTLADGTTTWMTGPHTLATHIIPTINKVAKAAGRPAPRIVASLPIALTNDVEAARQAVMKKMEIYSLLPSYRRMLDMEKEGGAQPADLAMLGDEAELRQQIQHLKEIGVTDFNAFCVPVDEAAATRTADFLAAEKSAMQS
jgi:F420-dependent oxidoreductase-like protein